MRGTVNHVDLMVRNLELSLPFYRSILRFFGYQLTNSYENGFDFEIRNGGFCSIGIVRATTESLCDRAPHSPGLHHLAWNAESKEDVDNFHQKLSEMSAEVLDPPQFYPNYGKTYYAVFFADPDGLKLEYVHWEQEVQPSEQRR